MAWIFELEADCVSEDLARAFASHFCGIEFKLPDGRSCHIGANEISIYERDSGHFGCCLVPTGASMTGRGDVFKTDEERTQLALFLYKHLLLSPQFHYAHIGLEVHELDLYDRNGALYPSAGLVICEKLFLENGSPPQFQPFCPGYFWVRIEERTRL